MGRRGRPPGMPEPGEEPQEWLPSEDEAASAHPPAEPAVPPVVQRPTTPVQPAQPRADQAATPDPAPPAPASEPTFEEIFGTPTPDAPEPTPAPTSRPAEPVAPVQTGSVATSGTNDGGASAVDALASAVGSSTSQTPWATATTASTAEPDRAPRERAPKASRQGKPRRERTRGVAGGIAILVVIVVILGGVFGGGWLLFGDRIMAQFAEPEDFAGAGEGEIVVRIEQGWSGGQVATMLEEEGVIADQQVFYDLLLADPSIGFQPGSYRLALEMSAQAALDALQDPANAAVLQATIPEGFVIQQVFARLAESTGVPESDFVQAASNPATFGVDASNLEGWLFPATYTFEDGATAESMLQTMVDRMRQALTERGVAEADWQRVITFASLVEREGGPAENFGQVARVFQNRLDIGMLLQSDATVHYGIGDFGVITTTDEERGDAGNAYNTYVHPGLPIGPIGAPGDAALDSVLAPADGPWLYFVTIDPSTGETVFSETLAEHNQAVLQFQEWLRANPDYGS